MKIADDLKKGPYNPILLLITLPISIIGLLVYKNTILIESGILGALGNLIYELHGTKNKRWKYSSASLYMIAGRVPIEVTLTYFFSGMTFATYIFFRLGI
jgi:hypothetical protein